MASFRKITASVLAAGLGLIRMSSAAERAKDPLPAAVPAVDAKKADAGKDKARLDLPVPTGQPQKGLRIPINSPEGKLLYRFQIGVAEKVDADHLKMGDLRLETFKDGEHEFFLELLDSVFNANTKEVTSNAHVIIKRHDFELSGNSVTFNIETKVGKFGGGVKMVIYDARAAAEQDDKKTAIPTVEVKPVTEEKK